MIVTAPAKINLYLKILRQRDDGYHEIETLFERISIFDRISIETTREGTVITCDDPGVPAGENSLLGKTVRAFVETAGKDLNFSVSLEKNIPVGAGLGGGSSDAAALLKGLNEISGFPLGEDDLLDISRSLGADVPFFFSDCSFGVGKGRGDIIEKLDVSASMWHVLVIPPFQVLTKDVYERITALDLTKDRDVDKMFTAFLYKNNINSLAEILRNDLQAIVLRDFPVLEKIFSELCKAGSKGVLVSGSGPTVFGIFERDEVEKAAGKMRRVFPPGENWRVCVAQTF
ncbi:MAG: 4-(cytidine 5'-diphospho)-2-C-methyl-D-erythritol kinase [Candidatus Omnitrophota bacterium]|nr:4-(cytidine 5'-diphospho)-2-C-methyl-D-erythritol kinase [Candidatus Omnitrophota bacterium]